MPPAHSPAAAAAAESRLLLPGGLWIVDSDHHRINRFVTYVLYGFLLLFQASLRLRKQTYRICGTGRAMAPYQKEFRPYEVSK